MAQVISESREVAIAEISVEDRLRPVSEAGVAAIAESVRTLGRFTDPVQVRRLKGREQRFALMDGAHRVEVAQRLGHEVIRAVVWECGAEEARLFEVDGNLARADLSVLEQCMFMAERKRVHLRLYPETARGGDRRSEAAQDQTDTDVTLVDPGETFASVIAEKRGISLRHAYRLISIGERLDGETLAALGELRDRLRYGDLMALADVPTDDVRRRAAERLADGAKNVRVALAEATGRARAPKNPVDQAFLALWDRFERAPMAAKRRFLDQLAGPKNRHLLEAALEGREA